MPTRDEHDPTELHQEDESESDLTPEERPRQRRGARHAETAELPSSVRLASKCNTRAEFEAYISNLNFCTFIESVNCENAPSIMPSISDTTEAYMFEHVAAMTKHVSVTEKYQTFFQNLEIAKQIEAIGQAKTMHSLNVVHDLANRNDINLGKPYLRELMNLSWAVYRFPVLRQVRLPWREALRVIPEIATHFDKNILNNESLPRNVRTAQSSRFNSAYLRLSLEFPDTRVGDGDGLCRLKIKNVHDFFLDDQPLRDESIKQAIVKQYPVEFQPFNGVPLNLVEKRSRLVGFDTQEAPRQRGRECDVDQRFWQNGRDFLETQLHELRSTIPVDGANILADCFGVDLYDRLLIDIRSVYNSSDEHENPQPSLRRFELARRALLTGYAFPTAHYFHSIILEEAFQTAIREKRGAFGQDTPFEHPRKCRIARFRLEKAATRQRRHLYTE